MRVNWIFADGYRLDPVREPDQLKSIGPTWGSWRTWRSCATDNVICHDPVKAKELINRAFQAVCNFYIPKHFYQDLNRPTGVKLYDGEFMHDLDHAEDIVAMHLVIDTSDIVLLIGFDFIKKEPPVDVFERHKMQNYLGMIHSVIEQNPQVQWVLVDHDQNLDPAFQNIPNLTCDTMENALKLLL